MSKPVVVIGDGWAALGAVSLLATRSQTDPERQIYWITGTGARFMSPLPTLDAGQNLQGGEVLKEILSLLEIDCGDFQTGSYLRIFKNKSFREPVWIKSPAVEERVSMIRGELWAPEATLVPVVEGRFALTINELDSRIREKLTAESAVKSFPGLKRITGIPLSGFRFSHGNIHSVILGSGQEIETDHVVYADRWIAIPELQGLPKGLGFLRKRDPVSVLQTVLTHEAPIGVGLMEGFYGPLQKEAGDDLEKHIWGHFSSDGLRSYWTLCLTAEEVEDNHAITKKLRRMKSALEKMFSGEAWRPHGKLETSELMSCVRDEQVRFEEGVLFSEGEVLKESISLPKHQGLVFMTDGYGPSSAMHQVGHFFGLLTERGAHSQAISVDSYDSVELQCESSPT